MIKGPRLRLGAINVGDIDATMCHTSVFDQNPTVAYAPRFAVGFSATVPRRLQRFAVPRRGLLLPPRPDRGLLHAPQLARRRAAAVQPERGHRRRVHLRGEFG